MGTYQTDSPVIFCIFNRPETTRRVFERIAEAQPPKLYIIADAPRADKAGEAERCRQTRAIAENITWDCELTLDYAETNLGCRQRLFSGVSKAFKLYEFAIILEDDCYPSNDFFRFVDTLRDRYSDDAQVTHISGTAFVRPKHPCACYYRSNFPIIWGWATWQKHWQTFDLTTPYWPELKQELLDGAPIQSHVLKRFVQRLDKAQRGEVNSWAYPYVAHTLKKRGHCLSPTYNLISNIGFGTEATTTINQTSPQAQLPVDPLPSEIGAPSASEIDAHYSNLQLINCIYRPKKILRTAERICKRIKIPYKPKLARPKSSGPANEAPLINLS